ncbi:UPF0481 protein [Spatholobus suberectus]|nr:UPF0481 protein [Spatholobus suberectus]
MTDPTAENQLERWLSPVKTMLGTLTHKRVRANSISDVPEQLKRSNVGAYKPKVVSIGPLHRKSSRDLLYMEEIKWQCMLSLLYRTDDPEERLTKCGKAILNYEEAVRACYMDPIEVDSNELAKFMLLDDCFLLELLLICNNEHLHDERGNQFPVTVGKMEEFLSDLKLLENQIPLFVIELLYIKLFVENLREDTKPSKEEWDRSSKKVSGHALFLFGCRCPSASSPVNSPNRVHFVELTHWFLAKPEQERSAQAVELTIEPHNDPVARCDKKISKETKPKLERCPARLQAAGVNVTPLNRQSGSSDIMFGCLVCCEYDVELLKSKEVLLVHDENKWSNEKLKKFIHDIADGIQIDASADPEFCLMIKDLNKCGSEKGNCNIIMFEYHCRIVLTKARKMCRYLFATLKRDHISTPWKTLGVMVAVLLLLLTIAQTVLAAIGLESRLHIVFADLQCVTYNELYQLAFSSTNVLSRLFVYDV